MLQIYEYGKCCTSYVCYLPRTVDPHNRESYRKQGRNFPYTVIAVLRLSAAAVKIQKKNLRQRRPSIRAYLFFQFCHRSGTSVVPIVVSREEL